MSACTLRSTRPRAQSRTPPKKVAAAHPRVHLNITEVRASLFEAVGEKVEMETEENDKQAADENVVRGEHESKKAALPSGRE